MQCPKCHHQNPPQAKFCMECGAKLEPVCSKCGANLPTEAKFCMACGTQVADKEYTAYGPDIILAKRLQETAKPGQILVGEGTYRPTRRAFVFQPLAPLTLKGIAEPVSAYQVLKPLPRPEKVRGIEGLKAEMIGREKEFAELKDCVDNLLAGGGQIVSIVGEAGVGKSRLVSELKTYIDRREEGKERKDGKEGRMEGKEGREEKQSEILWLEGRCISIGESIGYWVFIDILRSYLEFSEADTPKALGEKIVGVMKSLLPQRWEEIVPYISNLLSVKFGNQWDEKVKSVPAEQVKHQTFLALRDVFQALAGQKPTLLILEGDCWLGRQSLVRTSLLIDYLPGVRAEHLKWR